MSTSGEKVNVIIMRDNGEMRRLRVYRSSLRWFIIFCCITPCLAIIGIGLSFTLWQERSVIQQRVTILERTNEANRVKVERLTALEELLQREANAENKIAENIQQSNKQQDTKKAQEKAKNEPTGTVGGAATSTNGGASSSVAKQEAPVSQEESAKKAAQQEGPGHVEFPVLDTKQVAMGNVQVRLLSQNRIRAALDLRNLNPPHTISGHIFCTLSLASGESLPLELNPQNVGFFKIQHWKRAVLFANLQGTYDLTNAQLLIEVKTSEDELVYRNLYDIEQ